MVAYEAPWRQQEQHGFLRSGGAVVEAKPNNAELRSAGVPFLFLFLFLQEGTAGALKGPSKRPPLGLRWAAPRAHFP